MTRLKDKIAVITGAGTGIGRAIAHAMSREGAKVVLAGRRRGPLDDAVEAIVKGGGQAIATSCDVSRDSDTRRAVEQAESAFGPVNILVNNAGILSATTIESVTEDEWDSVMAINLKGPFLMSRAVLPSMRKAGGGSIVNVSSVLGLVAMKNRAAYCASKGGVTLLTKAMAIDHAADKIRVNCICPSIVETELVQGLFPDTGEGRLAKQSRLEGIPLGRFGKPSDIAGLAVYLASDESSWMTGAALPLDGGLSAQ